MTSIYVTASADLCNVVFHRQMEDEGSYENQLLKPPIISNSLGRVSPVFGEAAPPVSKYTIIDLITIFNSQGLPLLPLLLEENYAQDQMKEGVCLIISSYPFSSLFLSLSLSSKTKSSSLSKATGRTLSSSVKKVFRRKSANNSSSSSGQYKHKRNSAPVGNEGTTRIIIKK